MKGGVVKRALVTWDDVAQAIEEMRGPRSRISRRRLSRPVDLAPFETAIRWLNGGAHGQVSATPAACQARLKESQQLMRPIYEVG